MPESKSALAIRKYREEQVLDREIDAFDFPPAVKGDFVTYSRDEKRWKCGTVASEDGGFVTSVQHAGGFVQGIRAKVKRLVVSRYRLPQDLSVVLLAVANVTDQEKIREILKLFVISAKENI
jgi:hypothetical protein